MSLTCCPPPEPAGEHRPAVTDVLEAKLEEHLRHHGPVRDEPTLRAIVEDVLVLLDEPRSAPPACPSASVGRDRRHGRGVLAEALRLAGDVTARERAADVVHTCFRALLEVRRRDPAARTDELARTFACVIWRGLAYE